MSDPIRCKDCKFWDSAALEVAKFFGLTSTDCNTNVRRQNHPAGIGLCTRNYPPVAPFTSDEAFGWNHWLEQPSDIFSGPEHGCVRGEKKP